MDIEDLLVRSGAYRDLPEPLIVTSGEFLTPFFVNAEKLCGDPEMDAFLAAHGGSDREVISHSISLASRSPFEELVGAIAAHASSLLDHAAKPAISGGQRRDWLFSGPVARRLSLPHISLYKQAPGQEAAADRLVLRSPSGEELPARELRGLTVVHVVDMVTAASSCISRDPLSGRETGWVPMLRASGAEVRDLIAVVSRKQGGEEALAQVGVRAHSFAVVDEAFLLRRARSPADAVAFYRDPAEWTRAYLRGHGCGLLLAYLVDDPKKYPRLFKFLTLHRAFLQEEGFWEPLDQAATARLGKGLAALTAGEP